MCERQGCRKTRRDVQRPSGSDKLCNIMVFVGLPYTVRTYFRSCNAVSVTCISGAINPDLSTHKLSARSLAEDELVAVVKVYRVQW